MKLLSGILPEVATNPQWNVGEQMFAVALYDWITARKAADADASETSDGAIDRVREYASVSGFSQLHHRFTDNPKAASGGEFNLLPWQKRFLKGALGTDTAPLSIARGNGKSTLIGGIGAAALDGPRAFPRAEAVIVASSFEQSRIVLGHIQAFMGEKLSDRERWRVCDTAQNAQIHCRITGAKVRCLGFHPKRAHGLAPGLTICDEPAQWLPSTAERMIAALETAS